MSIEIYNQGKESGTCAARCYGKKLKEFKTVEALGAFCGIEMSKIVERGINRMNDYSLKTRTWQEGFFDGFMEEAEIIRSTK